MMNYIVSRYYDKTAPDDPLRLPVRDLRRTHRNGVNSSRPGRLEFLDACRGLAVLGMLLANMMNVFLRRVPNVLSHDRQNELRFFDFPAPVFQFLIGVSLVLFLERRRQPPAAADARVLAVRRFVLLMALGVVLDGIGALASRPRWGVLQTLGLGGVFATAIADTGDGMVALLAVVILAVFSRGAHAAVHHSPIAAVAFVPLTLGGLLVGRGLATGPASHAFVRRSLAVGAVGLFVATVACAAGVPFNKVLGTSSFVGIATTVSATLLLATAALGTAGLRYPSWLLAVGSNALTAWVLQYVLVYYPAWLLFPSWHRLPFAPGIVVAVAVLAALSALTVALGRRGIRIPI